MNDDSSQALPRHPQGPVYRCFLPDLAGFTSLRRAGPNPLYHRPQYGSSGLAEGRNSTPLERIADIGHRWLPV